MKENIKKIETELAIQLPPDYKSFVSPYDGRSFEFNYQDQIWTFLTPDDAIKQTQKLKANPQIRNVAYVFATNQDTKVWYYRREQGQLSSKIFLWEEGDDWEFYAFSFSELINDEKTKKLIAEIETQGFENQDIAEIYECPGSLYQYALNLLTFEGDENYAIERNHKALEIFLEVAQKQHPGAAHQLASHYYYGDQPNIEKAIEWFEKAITYGSMEDKYELADLILDDDPNQIDRAIELLEELLPTHWYRKRALRKLGRLYMRGLGGNLDYQKGIQYTKDCAAYDDYNCLADLAFYHYKGMGVEKNVKKAYELLVKANELSKDEEEDEGFWEEELEKLKKELGK